MPPITDPTAARDLLNRRSAEWYAFAGPSSQVWQWLLDSYEGGARYRDAVYGSETYIGTALLVDPVDNGINARGQQRVVRRIPRRNLIRHRREYPMPQVPSQGQVGPYSGSNLEYPSTDDPYELRRARTPVPGFVDEAVSVHLGKIYAREVRREVAGGPARPILERWWRDVDGAKTNIDDWMQEVVAPLLSVLGMLDLCADRPRIPPGVRVETQDDAVRLGLDRAVMSFILPQNMLWHQLNFNKLYRECLVAEYEPLPDGRVAQFFRHWTESDWTLYDVQGNIIAHQYHPYQQIPIVRVFHRRKPTMQFVGASAYEQIAEIQREYYNVDSELTLSNTFQAHPVLQMPSDLTRMGTSIAVGPDNVLPMIKDQNGSYMPNSYLSPPTSPADKLRQKLVDLEDRKDRAACLIKPAGVSGGDAGVVAQSGVSKIMDADTGNRLLTRLAKTLRKAEVACAKLVMMVASDGAISYQDDIERQSVNITYPTQFDLNSANAIINTAGAIQKLMDGAGKLPKIEAKILSTLVQEALPGLDDREYRDFSDEIDAFIAAVVDTNRANIPPSAPYPMPVNVPVRIPTPPQLTRPTYATPP